VCNGCESCEKVNSGKLLGWIFHCQKCDLTMCCECEMNPEDHSCDE
jgi:hypothetical protein